MSRPSSRSSARNSTCARTPSAVKAGVPGVCANAAVAVQASSRVERSFIDDPWRNEVLQAGVTVTSYGARAVEQWRSRDGRLRRLGQVLHLNTSQFVGDIFS